MASKLWPEGVSVPVVTPFLDTPERPVNHDALAKQVVRIAKAGLGIVVLGTNGEGEPLQAPCIRHRADL